MSVVASHPLYPDWKPKKASDVLEGVEILRGGAYLNYPKSAVLRRLVLEIWFAWYSALKVRQFKQDIDVVVVVFPPVVFSLVIGFLLPGKTKKIGIVHDLLGVMATSSCGYLRRLVAKVMRWVEIKAFSRCDKLICLSESMKREVIESYGIDFHKCVVHYPFVTLTAPTSVKGSIGHLFQSGFKHVVYSGALGEKQRPVELIKFFETLSKTHQEIICHIFSRGPIFEELSKEYSRSAESRVLFHDLVPESSLLDLYLHSDVQIIPQAEGTGAGAFPSKLPNLLAAGVPVFAICDADSELAAVLNESGAGRSVHSWQPKECVEGVAKLLSKIGDETHEQRRERLAPYVYKKFSVDALTRSILGE